MRVETVRWLKLITIAWPVIGFIGMLAFLAVFHRPLRRILEQFDCRNVIRIKIGFIEIVKQNPHNHTCTIRRKKNQSTRE